MTYSDVTIVCRECGDEFVFSSSEQEFYARKSLTHQPSRCASCRSILKGQRAANAMQLSTKSPGVLASGVSAQREYARQPFRREGRQMYDAICANCGGHAKVPFVPRGRRPVYCAACFAQHKR
jgi:CxxC-x17-CxxC domain-containing protein